MHNYWFTEWFYFLHCRQKMYTSWLRSLFRYKSAYIASTELSLIFNFEGSREQSLQIKLKDCLLLTTISSTSATYGIDYLSGTKQTRDEYQ